MPISLTPETARLIEQRMKETGASTPDELVRAAIQTLSEVQGVDYDELDSQTRAAIDEAEAEYMRGEGIPLDEAFAELRRKHLGE